MGGRGDWEITREPAVTPEERDRRIKMALARVAVRAFVARVDAQIIAMELAADAIRGIPTGDPRASGSWEVLEQTLGREAVAKMREGA